MSLACTPDVPFPPFSNLSSHRSCCGSSTTPLPPARTRSLSPWAPTSARGRSSPTTCARCGRRRRGRTSRPSSTSPSGPCSCARPARLLAEGFFSPPPPFRITSIASHRGGSTRRSLPPARHIRRRFLAAATPTAERTSAPLTHFRLFETPLFPARFSPLFCRSDLYTPKEAYATAVERHRPAIEALKRSTSSYHLQGAAKDRKALDALTRAVGLLEAECKQQEEHVGRVAARLRAECTQWFELSNWAAFPTASPPPAATPAAAAAAAAFAAASAAAAEAPTGESQSQGEALPASQSQGGEGGEAGEGKDAGKNTFHTVMQTFMQARLGGSRFALTPLAWMACTLPAFPQIRVFIRSAWGGSRLLHSALHPDLPRCTPLHPRSYPRRSASSRVPPPRWPTPSSARASSTSSSLSTRPGSLCSFCFRGSFGRGPCPSILHPPPSSLPFLP